MESRSPFEPNTCFISAQAQDILDADGNKFTAATCPIPSPTWVTNRFAPRYGVKIDWFAKKIDKIKSEITILLEEGSLKPTPAPMKLWANTRAAELGML